MTHNETTNIANKETPWFMFIGINEIILTGASWALSSSVRSHRETLSKISSTKCINNITI